MSGELKNYIKRNLSKYSAKVLELFGAVDSDLDSMEAAINTLADIDVISTTLIASNWSNGEYSFEATYPIASYDLAISFNDDIGTAVQRAAYKNAGLGSSNVANKIYAKATVPTIDIPIFLTVKNKLVSEV